MSIKIVTICGSVRPGDYTAKALRLVLDEFSKQSDVEVTPIFLDELDLPLPGLSARDPAAVERFQQAVKESTGVLLASPEYHGGVSSPMKLAIANLGFEDKLRVLRAVAQPKGRLGASFRLELSQTDGQPLRHGLEKPPRRSRVPLRLYGN